MKELRELPLNLQQNVYQRLRALGENPRPPGKSFRWLHSPVEVYQYTANYRLRVGEYRVLYDIDEKTRTVVILALRRRHERTYD